jgi:trehalose 6-phosphate phosphatase
MKRLFTPEAEAALRRTMQRDPLLGFDFDGTLAPIVTLPDDARIPTPVALRLQRVAERWPVAIITGRTIEDVRRRLPFSPWRIVGSHGAESHSTGHLEGARQTLEPTRQLLVHHAEQLGRHGVSIEDKGASVALHYRLASDRTAAVQSIARALASLPPDVSVFGGKMVANIVPAWADNKGKALAGLVAELGNPAAVFVGDDVNDESVFAQDNPDWFTVRVGHDYPNSQAKYLLDGVADVARLLDLMLETPRASMTM